MVNIIFWFGMSLFGAGVMWFVLYIGSYLLKLLTKRTGSRMIEEKEHVATTQIYLN